MRRILITLLLLADCAAAHAALGGKPSSLGATPARQSARSLAAAGNTGSVTNYTVSQSTLDGGTIVREYADSNGIVFAVSWNGPFLPDLRTLLGAHFGTMSNAAARTPKAGHSQLSVEDGDVVIVSNGHMRAFNGRAWIPASLPAGFGPDSIE